MNESGESRSAERDRRFARSDIEAIQKSTAKIDEEKIDRLLGVIGDFKRDEEFIGPDAATRFKKEKWGYQGTLYGTIRAVLRATSPQKGQIFYDLGSGQGRVVLYGALASEAKFIGIDLMQERVDRCEKTKARLGIENAEFRAGNITDFDISDGDIFYLFNPFSEETTRSVMAMLKQIAEKKKIKIVCLGGIELLFARETWVRQAERVKSPDNAYVFESTL